MCFGRIKTGRNNGFTLVELIIALVIFLVVTSPLLTTLKLTVERISVSMDYRKAFNRTSRVIALLKAPVFYCGYGMPVDPERYKDVFGNQHFDPFRWNGPINTAKGPSLYPNSELRIAYAQPGSTKLAECSINLGSEGSLELCRKPEESELASGFTGNTANLKNWIFFGSIMPPSLPLFVTGINEKNLNVKNTMNTDFSVSQGDRIYLFRAMSVYCRSDCVYTKDFRAAGYQPRVSGIQDIRFDVDIENRLVKIYILARGDTVYKVPPQIIGEKNWPKNYIQPWIDKRSKYQLFASKIVWGLPNCAHENFIDGKNITELF